jgi:serine/threonine protein kinase
MTLYKLLVGHLPFQRDMDAWQVLQAKQAGRVPLPAGLRSQLPEPLLAVIDRAIAPDPRERFAGCADFKDALVDASGHDWEPRVWAPLSPSKPEPVTTGAGYTQYAILAVLVALLVAVIWVGLAMHSEPGAEVATRTTPTPTTPAPSSPTPPPMQTTPPLAPAVSPTHETPTPSPTLRPAATPRVTPIRPSPTPEPVEVSTPPPSPAPTEARVRAQPTPVTEAPKMGLLYLTTEPKCLVEIDERTWTSEQTRMGLLFPPGRYTVRFVCDDPICDGFERRSGVKTLQVLAGDDTRYHADFHEINRR